MDLHKIISELQSEKQRLDEAIQALERLSVAPKGKKRGLPSLKKADADNGTDNKDLHPAKTMAQQG
jgi:hypothetical protein